MNARLTPVLAMLVLVVLAGCTGPFSGDTDEPQNDTSTPRITVTQNDGISMSFQSLSPEYMEGEQLVFQLDLENTGERMATGIEKELFGANFIARKSPYFAGKNRLIGVDRGLDRPGEETTVVWRIANPVDLEGGATQDFPAGVRVSYTYESTARGSFTIVPRSTFNGENQPVTTSNTAGPLQVKFDLSTPKPIFQSDTGSTQATIPVQIVNVGDGAVANIDGQKQDIRITNAEFLNSQTASISCPPTVRLFDGQRRFICTASLPSDVFRQQLTLRLDLEYPYFELQETSFSVAGVQGSVGQ